MHQERIYLSVQEFAAQTGLSVTTVRRRVKDGTLQKFQLGGSRTRILIPRDALPSQSEVRLNIDLTGAPCDVIPESVTGKPKGPRPQWQRTARLPSAVSKE